MDLKPPKCKHYSITGPLSVATLLYEMDLNSRITDNRTEHETGGLFTTATKPCPYITTR